MKRSALQNLSRRVLSLVLAAALLVPTAFATAGDAQAAGLIDTASDVMDLMTRLRADRGVTYPEEE